MGAGELISRSGAVCLIAALLASAEACAGGPDEPSAASVAPRRGRASRKPSTPGPPPPIESFFDVHGDTLSTPEHGHIPLPPGHAAAEARTKIHVSAARARVLVVTHRGPCGPRAVHVVDRVDLATRSVERIAEGDGWVAARFDGEEPRVAPQPCDP